MEHSTGGVDALGALPAAPRAPGFANPGALDLDVRFAIARRLGVDIGALAPANRHVDGVVVGTL